MALTTYTPQPVPDDLMTLDEVRAVLAPTPHPVSRSTLNRWIDRHHITRHRGLGGKVRVSMSEVFEAQRDEVVRRLSEP